MEGCMSALGGNDSIILSKGLAQLKAEHVPLLEKLHGLNALCSNIEKDENIAENFSKLGPAVKVFMAELEPHSEREEQVLFRMMENYLGVGVGPIAVMEYEHEQAKSLIGKFFEKTNDHNGNYSADEMKEYSSLINNAYYTLVNHFAKEENVLFPMAEKLLSDEEKTELAERIKQI